MLFLSLTGFNPITVDVCFLILLTKAFLSKSNSLIPLSEDPVNKYLLLIMTKPSKLLLVSEFIFNIRFLLIKSQIFNVFEEPTSIKL